MTTRKQIERGLEEIGACWAIRSDKYIDPSDELGSKPTYHVHPDREYPHVMYIMRFESLDMLWSWIAACKKAAMGSNHQVVCWTGDKFDVL